MSILNKLWVVVPGVLAALSAEAVGLGALTVNSSLGQPLAAEVDVFTNAGEKLEAPCFRLERPRADDGDLPWLARGNLTLVPTATGARLLLTTSTAVREPIVRVVVRIACGLEVTREYSLLLSPEAHRAEVVSPELPAAESRPAAAEWARRPSEPLPLAGRGRDTAESIGRNLYPHSRRQQRQFVDAFIAANPALELKPDTPIPPATPVVMPDMRPAAAVPEPPPRPPVTATAASPAPAAAVPPPARKTAKRRDGLQVADRLLISGGPEAGAIEVGEPRLRLATEMLDGASNGPAGSDTGLVRTDVTPSQRDIFRLEYRLLAALAMPVEASSDAAERRRQNERRAADYRQLADLLDGGKPVVNLPTVPAPGDAARAAAAPAAPSPPPAAAVKPAAKPEASSWADWIFYAVGLAAVGIVAGLLVYWRRYGRGRDGDPFADLDEPVADEPGSSDLFRPSAAGLSAGLTTPAAPVPAEAVSEHAATIRLSSPPPLAEPAPRRNPELDDMAVTQELGFEDNNVVELADIMLAFGRVKGATEILHEFIDESPKEALQPWIKLLDVYRASGMRKEFEEVAARLNKTYNVRIERWHDAAPEGTAAGADGNPEARSLEEFQHLAASVTALWGTAAGLEYLTRLLHDNRDGERTGFRREVAEEILFLSEILTLELGAAVGPGGRVAA